MDFFACYLLTPLNPPQRMRCTYVGFTVAPSRRIRQHNGEIASGAKRTRKFRPWEMIVVVHGFPSKVHALQFEFAWQHPYSCRFTKERLALLKGRKGIGHFYSVKHKLVELYEMLHILPWSVFPLTVTYTNQTIHDLARSLTPFDTWPQHMSFETRPLSDFAQLHLNRSHSTRIQTDLCESLCYICEDVMSQSNNQTQILQCYHQECGIVCHRMCFADHFIVEASLISAETEIQPTQAKCPYCQQQLLWSMMGKNTSSNFVPPLVTTSIDLVSNATNIDVTQHICRDEGRFEIDEFDDICISQHNHIIDLTSSDDETGM